MPTQNIHHKRISWRDHSGSTRLQYKKRQRKDFRGSRAIIFQINTSKAWIGHGTINCFDAVQVENFFQSEEITLRQTTTLCKASVITCSLPESAALGQVDVDTWNSSGMPFRLAKAYHTSATPPCRGSATAARVGAEFSTKETGRHCLPRAGARRVAGTAEAAAWGGDSGAWLASAAAIGPVVSAAASPLPSLCSCQIILSPDARSARLFVASVWCKRHVVKTTQTLPLSLAVSRRILNMMTASCLTTQWFTLLAVCCK